AEIRPKLVDENKLRIRRLPKEEVGEPPLTTAADDEISIGQPCALETIAEHRRRDRVRIQMARGGFLRKPARGGRELFARAVIESEIETERSVLLRQLLCALDDLRDIRIEAGACADEADTHIVRVKLFHIRAAIAPEETHQVPDLGFRTAPVL